MTPLSTADFSTFFKAVYGTPPFPWQARLLAQVAATGWPAVLDLPTGSGKTAALDVAVFNLALQAQAADRRAPLRIAFVVDRRLVVDDAFRRAEHLVNVLADAGAEPMVRHVAAVLRHLAGGGAPLCAHRLRGGLPREPDWVRTPCQPTILCSTVDQVGSRLLFRGYGVSRSMAPIHAGLLGSDCLLLLDEAHLAEPFRQTAQAIAKLPELHGGDGQPLQVALLTATPGTTTEERFALDEADRAHPLLGARVRAHKPAAFKRIEGTEAKRVEAVATEVRAMAAALAATGVAAPAIGVVLNRVARARGVFDLLHATEGLNWDLQLLIGPARPAERAAVTDWLEPLRTGRRDDALSKPRVLIATQTIEVGVDLDLDGLVTEAAALDALRQRFGRLNRSGRPVPSRATILAADGDLKPGDPVYGAAIGATWRALGGPGAEVDFGIVAFEQRLHDQGLSGEALVPLLAERSDAPVLMPAHVALWAQTAPIPACDPEPQLFLHGTGRASDSVRVVWRADLGDVTAGDVVTLLALTPPRAAEAIELPVWTVRAWLSGDAGGTDLADVAAEATEPTLLAKRSVVRWAGAESERTGWISPADITPGDTIVVRSDRGGCDVYGWNPRYAGWTDDLYDTAAETARLRRYGLRISEGMLRQALRTAQLAAQNGAAHDDRLAAEPPGWDREARRLADRVAATLDELGGSPGAREVAERLADLKLPAPYPARLAAYMAHAGKGGRRAERPVFVYNTEAGRRGVVLPGRLGPEDASETAPASEDDAAGSFPGRAQTLQAHTAQVRARAQDYATRAGLPASVAADIALAAALHDRGKADPRFQLLLAGGDVFAIDLDSPLAKSAEGRSPPGAAARVGLPERWRHEALSVRLALADPVLETAHDRALVLWLIGTHHGEGRPFFPHADPADARDRAIGGVMLPAGVGPQSLSFDIDGLDWTSMFHELRARYGTWGLARLEAVLRLADHRASEAADD